MGKLIDFRERIGRHDFPPAITDEERETLVHAPEAGGFEQRRRVMLGVLSRDSSKLRVAYRKDRAVFLEMLEALSDFEQHSEGQHQLAVDACTRMLAVMGSADREALFQGE